MLTQRTLTVTLLFAISGCMPLIGCETNPSTGRSQLIVVSSEETAQMGEQAKPELIKEYGGEVESAQLRQYVAQVGKRLIRHVEPEYAGTKWEFITLDSDVINAFALPGGKVFMSRGLLEQLNSEAALAGVLGHEIGHVTAKHVDERISHSMIVQGLAGVGSAAVGGSGGWAEVIPLVVGVGGQGYLLKFGRDQESEADRQGVKYMVKAMYDPTGMEDVVRVLIKASEGQEQWEMLSTHPDPKRRLTDVQQLIEKDYAFAVNNSQYRKFENRFDRDALPYLPKRQSLRNETAPLPASALWCAHCRAGSSAAKALRVVTSVR
jgi:predicted Zn-dependent protease